MSDHSYGIFSYWSDGNHQHELHPDPPTKEEARPFQVVFRDEHWIPISVLVFARDAKHARHRVETALQKMVELDRASHEWAGAGPYRAARIISDVQAGMLAVHVEPFNTDLLCARINWATNGGI